MNINFQIHTRSRTHRYTATSKHTSTHSYKHAPTHTNMHILNYTSTTYPVRAETLENKLKRDHVNSSITEEIAKSGMKLVENTNKVKHL